MRLTENVRVVMKAVLYEIQPPPEMWLDINEGIDGKTTLMFQAPTMEEVRAIRALFPGVFWKKRYDDAIRWWEFNGETRDGLKVQIYACREAPESCKAIEEVYEVEEQVPVTFETRTVTKTRLRFECGGGAA